jgi:menaquinone-dependent protoporphyrinogen oxidase
MSADRPHVLIVVGSRHGATREISGVLAQRLVTHGASVTVSTPEDCHEIDADAVVIGSGVYYGRWLKSAQHFVDTHAAELCRRPVWLFSSGPLGDPTETDLEGSDAGIEPDVVARLVTQTNARAHHVFAGRLDRDDLGPLEKLVAAGIHAPVGDFRDWQDVEAWADEIGVALCGVDSAG